MYAAGYTLGRTWIEMLRIDPANHFFGLRINVFTSIVVFLGAVLFLYLRRNVGREDPAVVRGPARRGDPEDQGTAGAGEDAAANPVRQQDEPTDPASRRPVDTGSSMFDVPVAAGDGEPDATSPNVRGAAERPGAAE